MRRSLSLFIAAAMLMAFIVVPVPVLSAEDDGVVRGAAPEMTMEAGRVYINGNALNAAAMAKLDMFYVAAKDVRYVTAAAIDTDDKSALPGLLQSLFINYPDNILKVNALYLTGSGKAAEPAVGDVLYIRLAAESGFPASEWGTLPLTADGLGEVASAAPGATLTADSLTLVPANIYTKYEYAIQRQGETDPLWKLMGSAFQGNGKDITAHFPASQLPYQVMVRVAGNEAANGVVVKQNGMTVAAPYINYDDETLGPLYGGANGAVWFVRINEGKKWESISVAPGGERFFSLNKTFGKKEAVIELRRYDLSAEGAVAVTEPPAGTTAEPAAVPNADAAVSVFRTTVQPRAELPKELKATGFVSDKYPTNWTLAGSAAYQTLEYTSDGTNWYTMDLSMGMPLLSADQQKSKQKAVKYQFRVPATPKANIPASKTKNFNQQKQVKTPSFKPNYKSEIVKVKEGSFYAFAPANQNPDNLKFASAANQELSISDAITKQLSLYIYTPENGKKSRSDYQILSFAPRATSPDAGSGLILVKGKAKLEKGYEFFGSKEKWGSYNKGDTKGLVRAKPTAKYNAKSNSTSGNAASRSVQAVIAYDADGKVALSASVESKKSIELMNWGIMSVKRGSVAYGSDSGANAQPVVALNDKGGSADVMIYPMFSSEAQSVIQNVTVTQGESNTLTSASGFYSANNLKVGDTLTITVKPVDPDAYRQAVYTLTVIAPLLEAPESTGMMLADSEYGKVRVSLYNAIALGASRSLVIELYEKNAKDPYFTTTEVLTYNANNTKDFYFDLRKEISSKGAAEITIKAYFEATGDYSHSNAATRTITLTNADLQPYTVILAEPLEFKVGTAIRIQGVLDRFGNNITEGSSYQWYRVSSSGVSTVITKDGNNPGYMPRDEDLLHYLEVMVYNKGGSKTIYVGGQVLF